MDTGTIILALTSAMAPAVALLVYVLKVNSDRDKKIAELNTQVAGLEASLDSHRAHDSDAFKRLDARMDRFEKTQNELLQAVGRIEGELLAFNSASRARAKT